MHEHHGGKYQYVEELAGIGRRHSMAPLQVSGKAQTGIRPNKRHQRSRDYGAQGRQLHGQYKYHEYFVMPSTFSGKGGVASGGGIWVKSARFGFQSTSGR
jgi:hypothetical protein